jgi:hypothetical protein
MEPPPIQALEALGLRNLPMDPFDFHPFQRDRDQRLRGVQNANMRLAVQDQAANWN